MTVTYSLEVSTVKLAGFGRLLGRWRGGIYKLVLRELIGFVLLYYAIFLMYRLALTPWQQHVFEAFCMYFRDFLDLIPITFVLGFYVSFIVGRWWKIFMSIPRVENIGVMIATYVRGNDERGRIIRRGLVRYQNLMGILCLRSVSAAVKKRFPKVQHLVDANLITDAEKTALENEVQQDWGNYFVPSAWFGALAAEAKAEGRIEDNYQYVALMTELFNLRTNCGNLICYDWISVPLVYTQVVSLSLYSFFVASIFGNQHLITEDKKYIITRYFPLFTFIQFSFYMGWLKVAEVMINPLGEDDDDFELNTLIDRNVDLGFMLVDTLYDKHPPLEKDPLWNEAKVSIPHKDKFRRDLAGPFLGSAANLNFDEPRNGYLPEGIENTTTPLMNAIKRHRKSISTLTVVPSGGIGRRDSETGVNRNSSFANYLGDLVSHRVANDAIAEADETVRSFEELKAKEFP